MKPKTLGEAILDLLYCQFQQTKRGNGKTTVAERKTEQQCLAVIKNHVKDDEYKKIKEACEI